MSKFGPFSGTPDNDIISWISLIFVLVYVVVVVGISILFITCLVIHEGDLRYDPLSYWKKWGLPYKSRVRMSRDSAARIIQCWWRNEGLQEELKTARTKHRRSVGLWFAFEIWHIARQITLIIALMLILINTARLVKESMYDEHCMKEMYLLTFLVSTLMFHESCIFAAITKSKRVCVVTFVAMLTAWLVPGIGYYVVNHTHFDNVFALYYGYFGWILASECIAFVIQFALLRAAGFTFWKRTRCDFVKMHMTACCTRCRRGEQGMMRREMQDENAMGIPLLVNFNGGR